MLDKVQKRIDSERIHPHPSRDELARWILVETWLIVRLLRAGK